MVVLPSQTSAWLSDSLYDDSVVAPTTANRPAPDRLHVLLVEDDPGDAGLVKYALQESRSPHFVVTHVTMLAAAIEAVTSDSVFDVVLLDLSLPDSAGVATFSRLQEVAPSLPIVIMTGLDDPEFANHALEVGAQDYLVKSDDPERTVARAIRYAITRMTAQIERDALAQRVLVQQRMLLKELATARVMQFDLLPRPERLNARFAELDLDVEAAFEPSSGIGGDLWGCMDCGDGRVAFYNFDFSGHGIGAALNVFRLHALIADRWDPGQEPAELLADLGAALPGLLGRGQYATMFFGIVDTIQGELNWAAAGAPAPILVQDGRAEFLDSRGVPLGLTKAPSYAGHKRAFPAGATLLLYSDVFTDSAGEDGEAFGEAGLMRLVEDQLNVGGTLTVERLLAHFYRHVPPPLPDDLTAVRISRILR
jgi:sigma-B regulation protein RsbU (phosphoserine phosphatase)